MGNFVDVDSISTLQDSRQDNKIKIIVLKMCANTSLWVGVRGCGYLLLGLLNWYFVLIITAAPTTKCILVFRYEWKSSALDRCSTCQGFQGCRDRQSNAYLGWKTIIFFIRGIHREGVGYRLSTQAMCKLTLDVVIHYIG